MIHKDQIDIVDKKESMEVLSHLSHKEHPLMLIDDLKTFIDGVDGDDDDKKKIVCRWCQEPMLGGSIYACVTCHYFMHKSCAQIEPVINHYLHLQHPLILGPNGDPWLCDICGDDNHVTGFRYNCSLCKFVACIKCSVVDAALKKVTNVKHIIEGHPQHTLALHPRPASFHCDACQTDDKDLFYQCNDCPFWIHKTCATLAPNIFLRHYHHHPLHLAYGIPERFYNFSYDCAFCKKVLLGCSWLYYCENCRYFAHIKCALNADQQPSTSRDDAQEQANDRDFLHFPMSEAFTNPLKLLYLKKETLDDVGAVEVNHLSHDHPLILNVESQGNIELGVTCNDPIEVCFGCVQPLTRPYYSCKDGCNFFLHKYCVELPRKLEHKLHPNHSLDLVCYGHPPIYSYKCSGCYRRGNTFAYTCKTCKFYLDVNCAFLPKTIKHESHEHPLVQEINPKPDCKACGYSFGGISYLCKGCDFLLDMFCTMQSPYSLAHRYCKGHEIPLTYPPIEDHLEDFYCTICEVEMHPKFWLYHCQKCDNSISS